ncbi:MAG: RadC family protein [Limisphaerales bacterium]
MEHLEQASNEELLSNLASRRVAQQLMQHYGRLTNLAQASFDDLQRVKGVGKSRAAVIKAAFLLAQRLSQERWAESPLLDSPERVADLLREQNRVYTVESLQVVFLNTRRRLIGVKTLTQGTLDSLLVHPREVFGPAIEHRASALILVHNHPGGDPTPSQADIRVTRELIRAGQLLRIEVLDHVILGQPTLERPKDFVSLREAGVFY